MGEALTPQEAQAVHLSINPFVRVVQIRDYAADMHPISIQIGGIFSPNNPVTRHSLVTRAKLHETAKPHWKLIEHIKESERLQRFGSVVIDARHRFTVN